MFLFSYLIIHTRDEKLKFWSRSSLLRNQKIHNHHHHHHHINTSVFLFTIFSVISIQLTFSEYSSPKYIRISTLHFRVGFFSDQYHLLQPQWCMNVSFSHACYSPYQSSPLNLITLVEVYKLLISSTFNSLSISVLIPSIYSYITFPHILARRYDYIVTIPVINFRPISLTINNIVSIFSWRLINIIISHQRRIMTKYIVKPSSVRTLWGSLVAYHRAKFKISCTKQNLFLSNSMRQMFIYMKQYRFCSNTFYLNGIDFWVTFNLMTTFCYLFQENSSPWTCFVC